MQSTLNIDHAVHCSCAVQRLILPYSHRCPCSILPCAVHAQYCLVLSMLNIALWPALSTLKIALCWHAQYCNMLAMLNVHAEYCITCESIIILLAVQAQYWALDSSNLPYADAWYCLTALSTLNIERGQHKAILSMDQRKAILMHVTAQSNIERGLLNSVDRHKAILSIDSTRQYWAYGLL